MESFQWWLGAVGAAFAAGGTAGRYLTTAQENALKSLLEAEKERTKSLQERIQSSQDRINKLESSLAQSAGTTSAPVASEDPIPDSEEELWVSRPPPDLNAHVRSVAGLRTKIITIGNNKGGVGKTTLTTNLAAYFDRVLGKRVLVIDLDYQGSATSSLLRAAKIPELASLSGDLIDGKGDGRWLTQVARTLHPALPKTKLMPTSYDLDRVEGRMLLRWFVKHTPDDVRYNLARALHSQDVQNAFDVILIDVGPRLTTGAVSALVASTHLIVPTNLDGMSTETIRSYLKAVHRLKNELNPNLILAGVVGTFSATMESLRPNEQKALNDIRLGLAEWPGSDYIFKTTIARRQAFANHAGHDVASLRDPEIKGLFQKLGSEVTVRVGL